MGLSNIERDSDRLAGGDVLEGIVGWLVSVEAETNTIEIDVLA